MHRKRATLFGYVLRRLLQIIPTMLGIIVVNFIIIQAAPGDPVSTLVGEGAVSEEYVQEVRSRLGLDRPVHEQLWRYVTNVASGDLGRSYVYRQPVLDLILQRVPATLLLMGTSFVLSSLIGVITGVVASTRPGSLRDNMITIFALVGYSTPVFWLGHIGILIFALRLGVLPSFGMSDPRIEGGMAHTIDVAKHLVLPASVLTVFNMALISRLTRSSMLENLRRDFITTARAKGLSERRVIWRHALPNSLLPVITVIGLNFGFLLSGAVLTETVFAWPGLGRLMIEAVRARDTPVLLGLFIVTSVMVIIANLITDLAYVLINPRIGYD